MGVLNNATPGDHERARTTRLVLAERYYETHPGHLTPEQRDAVAVWVRDGVGAPPWELPEQTGGQPYPPNPPAGGPRG